MIGNEKTKEEHVQSQHPSSAASGSQKIDNAPASVPNANSQLPQDSQARVLDEMKEKEKDDNEHQMVVIEMSKVQPRKPSIFDTIPEELIQIIIRYLPAKDLTLLSLTCRFFNKICLSDDLWRLLYFRDWAKFRDSVKKSNHRAAFLQDSGNDNSSERSLFSSILRRPSNIEAMINPRQHYQRKLVFQGEDKCSKEQAKKKKEKAIQLYKTQKKITPFLEFFGWRLPLITGGILPLVTLFFLVNNLEYNQQMADLYGNSTNTANNSQFLFDNKIEVFDVFDFEDNSTILGNITMTPTSYPKYTIQPTFSPTIHSTNFTGNITVQFIPWYVVFAPLDAWFFVLMISLIFGTVIYARDNPGTVFYGLNESYTSLIMLTREFWNEVDQGDHPYAIPLIAWVHFILLSLTIALITVKLETPDTLPQLSWTLVYLPLFFGIFLMIFPEYVFGNRKLRNFEVDWALEWLLEFIIGIGLLLVTLYADGYLHTTLAIALIPFWMFWISLIVLGVMAMYYEGFQNSHVVFEVIVRIFFFSPLVLLPSGLVAIAAGAKYPDALYGTMIACVAIGVFMVLFGIFIESQFMLIDPAEQEEDDPWELPQEESNRAISRYNRELDANKLIQASPSFFFSKESDIEQAVQKLTEHANKTKNVEKSYFNSEDAADEELAEALAQSTDIRFDHDQITQNTQGGIHPVLESSALNFTDPFQELNIDAEVTDADLNDMELLSELEALVSDNERGNTHRVTNTTAGANATSATQSSPESNTEDVKDEPKLDTNNTNHNAVNNNKENEREANTENESSINNNNNDNQEKKSRVDSEATQHAEGSSRDGDSKEEGDQNYKVEEVHDGQPKIVEEEEKTDKDYSKSADENKLSKD